MNPKSEKKPRKKSEKPEGLDSFEELYFSWYLDELKKAGVITLASYHPETMELCKPKETYWLKQLKTKSIKQPKVLLNNLEYTPDWLIYWNPILLDRFIFCPRQQNTAFHKNPYGRIPFIVNIDSNGRYYSYIDVKSAYSSFGNKSNKIFSIIQKVVLATAGEYIQGVNPYELFRNTFSPKKFMTTDKTFKPRKKAEGTIGIEQYFKRLEVPIQMELTFENP